MLVKLSWLFLFLYNEICLNQTLQFKSLSKSDNFGCRLKCFRTFLNRTRLTRTFFWIPKRFDGLHSITQRQEDNWHILWERLQFKAYTRVSGKNYERAIWYCNKNKENPEVKWHFLLKLFLVLIASFDFQDLKKYSLVGFLLLLDFIAMERKK